MTKVLVTGGAGYVGSVLVRKLLDKGYDVRVYDRMIFGDRSLNDIKKAIELVRGDIREIKSKHLKGIDAIIHLAGFSTEPTSQYDPRLTDVINHLSTEHLAKLARKQGIRRFVYASSCSVYFSFNTPLNPSPSHENEIVNPISSYSITKRCSEQVLWGMTNSDFKPTIFRKGTVYGYSPKMRYDLVFNSFVKDAFFKKTLTVDAAGEIWRPLIDIQDVADIYIKAIELPLGKVGGKIFNMVDKNWKIGDLAKKVKDIVRKKKKIKISLDIKPYGITRNYKADYSVFKKTFQFKSSRNLEKALLEMWENFEKNKKHDPHHHIHYSDLWYKKFFETREGRKFKRHV